MKHDWKHPGRITRYIDGDTIEALIDLGFGQFNLWTIRLLGINTPEMNTPGGEPAKQHLRALCEKHSDEGRNLYFVSHKPKRGNFGRYLFEILSADMAVNINQQMISDGHAVPYRK